MLLRRILTPTSHSFPNWTVNDFNPSDLLHSLAPLLDEGEAGRLRELVALLEAVDEEGDWTNDSYLVMSHASPAMEERVLQLMAPTFAGEAGRLRRQEWDERREALKRELDSQKGGARGAAGWA